MRLFKAIKYDGDSSKTMTSIFNRKYKFESCWDGMIITAFSHISSGDHKIEKDYWISTTKSFATAVEYLRNKKDYQFNGIAIIDLPNTNETGRIYDPTLRDFGYIDKSVSVDEVIPLWSHNEDGVVASLDMSSQFTINYLAAYLWLKGRILTLGNQRAITYANSKDEVLLIGNGIKFEFVSEEEIAVRYNSYLHQDIIYDYNMELYKLLIQYAPESTDKDDFLKANNVCNYKYMFGEIEENLREKGVVEEYIAFEVAKEISRIKDQSAIKFFENAKYCFDRKVANGRFLMQSALSYKDKDIIDFEGFNERYEVLKSYKNISFNDCIDAYINAGAYYHGKMNFKLKDKNFAWKVINMIYNYEYIPNGLPFEDFVNIVNSRFEFIRIAEKMKVLKNNFDLFEEENRF